MYCFCPLNTPEPCRTIKRWRYLAEQKGVGGTCDVMFPRKVSQWHLDLASHCDVDSSGEAPFADCLVFSGKEGREDPVSQTRVK